MAVIDITDLLRPVTRQHAAAMGRVKIGRHEYVRVEGAIPVKSEWQRTDTGAWEERVHIRYEDKPGDNSPYYLVKRHAHD